MKTEAKIKKDSYLYNTISGMLNAFQSVLILMVLNRTFGLEAAGVFTIAYAVANLMMNIGKYGMRNYQATDVNMDYNATDYLVSRIISTTLMILSSVGYVLFSAYRLEYTFDKTATIIFMCLWRSVDSVEDVYQGELQRRGRLDLASIEYTYRQLFSLIVFIICGFLLDNLLQATIVTTISSVLSAIVLLVWAMKQYSNQNSKHRLFVWKETSAKSLGKLFLNCLPLFIATFLSFYLVNAPKYAIDAAMSSEVQAKYGFISMPVFVVGLLAQFIYRPILNTLAEIFSEGKINVFKREVNKQILYIAGITLVVLLGGFILGIFALSILYGTDLNGLRPELMVLLIASGIQAFDNLMLTILTLIRKTRSTMYAHIAASIIELVVVRILVNKYALMGASVALLIGMSALGLMLTIIYIIAMRIKHSIN